MKKWVLTLVLLLLPVAGNAKILFVNNSGTPACSDSTTYANNSMSNPWCTVLRAMRGNTDGNRDTAAVPSQAAQAGDRVYINAGTYDYTGADYGGGLGFDHPPLFMPVNSGTSDNWITFQASGGQVVLTGNETGSACQLGTNSTQYLKFIGFSINQANMGLKTGNGVVCVRVSNVLLEDLDITGVYTDYGFDDNHTGLMIHGPRSGDCTGEITNITVRNSKFHGFTGASSSNDTGTTIYCAAGLTFEYNEYYSNHNGIMSKTGYTGSTDSVIRYNLFHSNGSVGVLFQSLNNTDIYQNVFRDNVGGFMFNNNNQPDGSPNGINLVNNTFDGNTYGVGVRGDCADLVGNNVYNNIVTNATYGFYSESASCETTANMGSDDVDSDYNTWEVSGGFFRGDGYDISTFANWQSSYGQDANSSDSATILYADETGNDFRQCTGSGTPVAGCSGVSPGVEGQANEGVDILDLDGDSSTVDAITIGAYITGNETIGLTGETANIPPSAPTGIGGGLVLNDYLGLW